MSEPISASIATYFSITKVWSITAGVCGSIIPILALADKTKISVTNAFFMALTGSSFSMFVGPWLAQKLDFSSIEGIVALSWVMGATGVFIVRAFLNWLDKRGEQAIDKAVDKIIGVRPSRGYEYDEDESKVFPPNDRDTRDSRNTGGSGNSADVGSTPDATPNDTNSTGDNNDQSPK